jgi:hypothetical protein
MNWPNLASTKAQHAPAPGTMQSSRPSPVHTALMNAQSMIGGTIHNNRRNVKMVKTVSLGVANRFSLNHPTTPVLVKGGAIVGLSSVRT